MRSFKDAIQRKVSEKLVLGMWQVRVQQKL
jgi:hypothetical protein